MATSLILIPTHDNEGEPFPRALFRDFETRIATVAGGVTWLPNQAAGVWLNNQGVRFDDRSYVYLVEFDDLNRFPAILDVVRWARVAFRQEAMFVYVVGSGIVR